MWPIKKDLKKVENFLSQSKYIMLTVLVLFCCCWSWFSFYILHHHPHSSIIIPHHHDDNKSKKMSEEGIRVGLIFIRDKSYLSRASISF